MRRATGSSTDARRPGTPTTDFGETSEVAKSQIERDERARLEALEGETTQVFVIKDDPSDNRGQQRMMPVSYDTRHGGECRDGTDFVRQRSLIGKSRFTTYALPGSPTTARQADVALAEFRELATSSESKSLVATFPLPRRGWSHDDVPCPVRHGVLETMVEGSIPGIWRFLRVVDADLPNYCLTRTVRLHQATIATDRWVEAPTRAKPLGGAQGFSREARRRSVAIGCRDAQQAASTDAHLDALRRDAGRWA